MSKAETTAREIIERQEYEIQANSRIDRSRFVQWANRVVDEFNWQRVQKAEFTKSTSESLE